MSKIQFDLNAARQAGASDREIADYLASQAGFDIAGARKAGAADADIVGHLAAPIDLKQGDFSRGFGEAMGQVKPLAQGLVGLAGATGEQVFGEGGLSTAAKNYGLKNAQEGMQANAERYSRPNDDVSTAWERAQQGDIGALIDWAQHGLGYVSGQIVQSAAGAAVGGVIGGATAGPAGAAGGAVAGAVEPAVVRGLASRLISNQVAKEAAKLAEAKLGKEAGEEALKGFAASAAVQSAATKSVAKNIGAAVGIGANAGAMQFGSIYLSAEQEAQEQGRKLDGGDIARIWGAGALATLVEGGSDALGLGALTGKLKLPGVGGRASRGIIGGAVIGGAEGATELTQTALERYGAGQSLTDAEARSDYLNSTALGVLGGGAVGAASGAMYRPKAPVPPAPTTDEIVGRILSPESTIDDAISATTDLVLKRGEALGSAIDAYQGADEGALRTEDFRGVSGAPGLDGMVGPQRADDAALRMPSVKFAPTDLPQGPNLPADAAANLQVPGVPAVGSGMADTSTSVRTLRSNIAAVSGERTIYGDTLAMKLAQGMENGFGAFAVLEQEREAIDKRLTKLAEAETTPQAAKDLARLESNLRQIEAAQQVVADYQRSKTQAFAGVAQQGPARPGAVVGNVQDQTAQPTVDQMVANNQQLRMDSAIENSDANVDTARQQQAQASRQEVLQQVLADPNIQNPVPAYQAALARAGIRDVTVTQDERATIQRAAEMRETLAKDDVAPAAPANQGGDWRAERDAAGVMESRKRKGAKAAPAPQPRQQMTTGTRFALTQMARLFGKKLNVYDRAAAGVDADGFFDRRATDTINVASDTSVPHMAVFFHELFHALESDNPQAAQAIKEVVRLKRKDGAAKFARYYGADANTDLRSEMTSDLLGTFAMDTGFWKDVFDEVSRLHGAQSNGIIRRLSVTVRRVIQQLVRALAGTPGFKTKEWIGNLDQVQNAMSKAVAEYIVAQRTKAPVQEPAAAETAPAPKTFEEKRKAAAQAARQQMKGAGKEPDPSGGLTLAPKTEPQLTYEGDLGMPEFTLVDGVSRPSSNSDGIKIAATREGVRNFWKWFGDSKVVDAGGRPVTVYHGTSREWMESPKVQALWATTDKDVASGYAEVAAIDRGRVLPLYLKIANPLEIDANGAFWSEVPYEGKTYETDSLTQIAYDKGFDGLIIKNVKDGPNGEVMDAYMALKNTQVKSAIGNNGGFDGTSPDILRSNSRGVTVFPDLAFAIPREVLDAVAAWNKAGGKSTSLGLQPLIEGMLDKFSGVQLARLREKFPSPDFDARIKSFRESGQEERAVRREQQRDALAAGHAIQESLLRTGGIGSLNTDGQAYPGSMTLASALERLVGAAKGYAARAKARAEQDAKEERKSRLSIVKSEEEKPKYADLEGKALRQEFKVRETGKTAVLERDAAETMRELDDRQTALERLLACVEK